MSWEKFFSFIRARVPTLVALALGLLSFKIHSLLPNTNSYWGKTVEHMGVAFLVTGIVILYYEYGAKEKKVHESLEMLNNLRVSQGQQQLRICFDLLFRDSQGKSTKHLSDVRENLLEFINHILDLQKKALWAKDQYISFLNYLFRDVVVKNATHLVDIGGVGNKSFHVPLAAEMADRILEAQMRAMEKGHTYDVISDLSSWQNDQLKLFRVETKERVKDGVRVRRVFNLLHPHRTLNRIGLRASNEAKIQAIQDILLRHLEDSTEWGSLADGTPRYEVRILGKRELASSNKKGYLEDLDISKKHVGLFHHAHGVVQFTVTRPELSDMALSTDPERIEEDLAIFNVVWNYASSPLDQKRIQQVVEEFRGLT